VGRARAIGRNDDTKCAIVSSKFIIIHRYLLCTRRQPHCSCSHLSPLAEDLVEASKGEPVLDVVVLVHAFDCLLDALFAELDLLYPTLDVLLGCKLEHLLHLGPVSDVGRAHVAAVGCEDLGGHGRERVVREADHVEGTVDLEDGEVFGEIELVSSISGIDDEVELELPWLSPALVLGDDEVLSTHLHRVLLLVGRVRDDVGVGAHGYGPKDTEVTKSSKSDDTDLLAGASS